MLHKVEVKIRWRYLSLMCFLTVTLAALLFDLHDDSLAQNQSDRTESEKTVVSSLPTLRRKPNDLQKQSLARQNSLNSGSQQNSDNITADSDLDTTFNPTLGFPNSGVNYVADTVIQPDGKIVIVGDFNLVNGVSRSCVARLNNNGTLDSTFDPGTGASGGLQNAPGIYAVARQTDGKILVIGDFTQFNGISRTGLARLNQDGSLDVSFNPVLGGNPSGQSPFGNAVTALSNGQILISGAFTNVNGVFRDTLARLNSDGSLDTAFDAGVAGDDFVYTLLESPDGKYLAGGTFQSFGGTNKKALVRLNNNGSVDNTFSNLPTTQTNPAIFYNGLALQNDGKIIVGATNIFSTSNTSCFVIRLNQDGTQDTSFNNAFTGGFTFINATTIQSDGKILVGGDFQSLNNVGRNNIARLNSDGSLDMAFNANTNGSAPEVFGVALQSDGKIIISGFFDSVNGAPRTKIARLLGSGATCTSQPSGAIAWWKGEGNTNDALGNYNGTVQGNVNYAAGKVGQAFNFSGSLNELVTVQNFPITRQFSVEGWIKLNALEDYYTMFDVRNNPPAYYSMYGYGYEFGFVTTCFSGDNFSGCLPYVNYDGLVINDTTTFHHIAVSHDGSMVSMYLDGQYFPNTNGGNNQPRLTLQETLSTVDIGGLSGYSGAGVNIDELTIYNRGLSASEIQAIYNIGSGGKCSPAALVSLTLNPNPVNGGQNSTGTVTLLNPAPAGGAVVNLSSTNTNIATVPASIMIPQGAASGTFTVSTSAVTANTLVNISATYAGESRGATLSVLAPMLDLAVQQFQTVPTSPVEAGTAVQLNAQIVNLSAADAMCHVRFYRDSISGANLIAEQTGVAVNANGQVNVSVSWNTTGFLGTYNIIANIENVVPAESNTANNSATLSNFQILDTTPPATSITAGPTDGQVLQPAPVTFVWTGTDNSTSTNNLLFQYQLDGGAWSPAAADTTVTFSNLGDGQHVFNVRAVDLSNNTDQTPATRTFTIDGTPPTVSNLSATNIVYNGATVSWATNENSTGVLQYAVGAAGAFDYSVNSPVSAVNHSVNLSSLDSNKLYRLRVVATDAAGNQATSAEATFTTAPLHDVSVSENDIFFSSETPGGGQNITMSARIRNNGDAAATATVLFFDVPPGNGSPVQIGSQIVTVPAFSNGVVAASNSFTVAEGAHSPYVQLTNISPDDNITNNHSANKNLLVGAPTNRFSLSVSNPRTFPNNDATFIAVVKNTGSQAQSLTDASVTGAAWISRVSDLPVNLLQPNEEIQIAFRMQTPTNEPGGTANNPVLKPVIFTVTGGESAPVNFNIEVFNVPPAQLDITVTDALTNQPLQNALVAVEGLPTTYNTNAMGKPADKNGNPILIQTAGGSVTINAYKQDFAAATLHTDGAQPISFALNQSGGLEVSEIQVRELTPEEIIIRGVDINDPVNNTVYDFEIRYCVDTSACVLTLPNVELPHTPPGGTTVSGGGYIPPGGASSGGGYSVNYTFTYTTPTTRRETWIIIPGDIRVLKQFWEATVFLKNTTTTPLNNVQATLSLPNGLAFPELFGAAQTPTKQLGTLAPNQVKQAQWVIRGDLPGRYRLMGTAQADGIAPINLVSNEIEVAQPKLNVTFLAPLYVVKNVPFDLTLRLRNDSPIPLNLVRVRIKTERLENVVLNSASVVDLGTIAVGETKTATFNFTPQFSGTLFSASITSPTPVEPNVRVTQNAMIWRGTQNSDWFNPLNWQPNIVPPTGSPVLIPTNGVTNYPTANSTDVTLSDLTLSANSNLMLGGSNLTVTDSLNLNGGNLDTGNNTLTLGANAVVNRTAGYVIGTMRKQFAANPLVLPEFTFPVGTANGYSPVRFSNISGAGLISVKANQGAYSGAATGLPLNRLARWWQIENQGGGITQTDLHFSYLDSDITGTETDYLAYRISGGIATNISGSVSPTENTILATNVTQFSDWTAAEVLPPNSATVSVGGRVTTADGRGISKAVVTLTGLDGEIVSVRTNAFGYFRFDEVESGATYILSVRHKRHNFAPRTITVLKDVWDLDFVAEDLSSLNFEKADECFICNSKAWQAYLMTD